MMVCAIWFLGRFSLLLRLCGDDCTAEAVVGWEGMAVAVAPMIARRLINGDMTVMLY